LWAKNRRIYRKTLPVVDSGFDMDTRCIWSKLLGYKIGPGDEYIADTPKVWGKWLTVPAGVPHKFEKGDSFMLWLVVETWKPGYDMNLISDFRITQ
jgi:hypothetical protein